jgi:plasmid stabilization system protein ParE
MAKRQPALAIQFTLDASDDLIEIYDYNAEHKGVRQADAWDRFLKARINDLAKSHHAGRVVTNSPELKHIVCKKRPKDDGHIVVYEVDLVQKVVIILRIFHTKQDWQSKL